MNSSDSFGADNNEPVDSIDDVPFDVAMDGTDETPESDVEHDGFEQDAELIAASQPFVGEWNQLISQTNWEKGGIISRWRSTLINTGAIPQAYSDEAWSRQVGGVTPQHVGRLRRVFDRFHETFKSYKGLYWSHFLAALEWNDAEIWLEGAVQKDWSISQMRKQRWEAVSGDPSLKPRDQDIITGELDEDFTPLSEANQEARKKDEAKNFQSEPLAEGPDFGEEDWSGDSVATAAVAGEVEGEIVAEDDWQSSESQQLPDNPFVNLPSMPTDVAEALEQFKLAIIRHRAMRWVEIAQDDVLKTIAALKAFAEQPAR